MNVQQLLAQLRAEVREASVADLAAKMPEVLIDVRELDEYEDGSIEGALHIPRGKLELRIEEAVPNRDADVVLYCAGGNRSALAAKTLAELGYERTISLAGGYTDWQRSGLPTDLPR